MIITQTQLRKPEHTYLKFLTSLTLSVEKIVNLHEFKLLHKAKNINVLFSQCGSKQHVSASHQM